MVLGLAQHLDNAFIRASFRSRHARPRPVKDGAVDPVARYAGAARFYDDAAASGRLFPAPSMPAFSETFVSRLPGGRACDLGGASAYLPLDPAFRALLDRHAGADRIRIRWLRHERPAPAAIHVHGWFAGHYWYDEWDVRARRLFDHGLDVVLFTLPFHGLRGGSLLGVPPFPSPSPACTNEGLAQAVQDLRAVMLHLRHHGAPAVGLLGQSLGGATVSLLATVEPGIDFLVPIVPVASAAELMWTLGQGGPAQDRAVALGLTREGFLAAFAATSPLSRAPLIAPERVLVLMADHDRVVPASHGLRLRDFFRCRPVVLFRGSHVVQFGKGGAVQAVLDLAAELGVLR
jgi:pimeloyl-ACP methyl ester carboxylesterase